MLKILQILGATGGVFVVDVTNTIVTPSENTNYEGVTAHYLTQDDSIDLTTGIKKALHFFASKNVIRSLII